MYRQDFIVEQREGEKKNITKRLGRKLSGVQWTEGYFISYFKSQFQSSKHNCHHLDAVSLLACAIDSNLLTSVAFGRFITSKKIEA